MTTFGHKLTIKGKGVVARGYHVSLDDAPLDAMSIDVHYEIDAPITATITLYINELDIDADVAPGLVHAGDSLMVPVPGTTKWPAPEPTGQRERPSPPVSLYQAGR